MKYKVAQIIPYFGRWPEWIELYFYSCGKNPMVDFIFYTDCPLPKHIYANTIFHQCTFNEYAKMVSERLGLDELIKRPYKLTDLKPFLGKVHEEELSNYNFWGFGDLDLVHGDLSVIVNDTMLNKYDVITTHSYRIAGHFTLLRNNAHYRNLCLNIPNWQHNLPRDKHFGYDEMDLTRLINPYRQNIDRLHRYVFRWMGIKSYQLFDFFNSVLLKRMHMKEYFTTPSPVHHQKSKGNYCFSLFTFHSSLKTWTYDVAHGKVTDSKGKEIPYLHFLCFKKNIWMESDCYWCDGFYKLKDTIEAYKTITINKDSITGNI